MPIVASFKKEIEYPLSGTGIEGLKGDFLVLSRLTQRQKIEYGPKIYDPWLAFHEAERKIKEFVIELVNDPEKVLKMIPTVGEIKITPELVNSIKEMSEESKRNLAALAFSGESGGVITDRIKKLQVQIDKGLILQLFKECLIGWNEGFYLDENGDIISPTDKDNNIIKKNIDRITEDLNVEKVILPAVIYLFQMSDMRTGGLDFLSGKSSTGGNLQETARKKKG